MAEQLPLKKRLALIWVPILFKWYFLLLGLTCKKTWVGKEKVEALEEKGENWIYAMWHNNVSTANYILRNKGMVVLVSPSFDGQMVTNVLHRFHNEAERGSSSRGGARALLKMIKRIKAGQTGVITPDGPRGPKYKLEPGAISLAQKTGRPLIPFHMEYSKAKVLERSWDQHQLPRFFSEIFISLGDPYYVPPEMDEKEFNQRIQEFEGLMMENVSRCEALAKSRNSNEV